MKLLQTLVSGTGFREPTHNARRLAVLDELLAQTASEQVDLIMLPGGYLIVGSEGEMPNALAEITRRANEAKVTIAAGVDLPETPTGKVPGRRNFRTSGSRSEL